MRGPGPAAGAPVAVATLPSRGLPRPVQFSVAKSVQFSKAKSVQFSTAIDTRSPTSSFPAGLRGQMELSSECPADTTSWRESSNQKRVESERS